MYILRCHWDYDETCGGCMNEKQISYLQVTPFFDGQTRCCVNRVKFKIKVRLPDGTIDVTYYKCAKCVAGFMMRLFNLPISPQGNLYTEA